MRSHYAYYTVCLKARYALSAGYSLGFSLYPEVVILADGLTEPMGR